jgi:adenylate kinase
MNLVLFGKPGAGKGTQAPKIAEQLGLPTLATGNVLRSAVKQGTALGLEAKGYMDRGDLVPDSVILGIVAEEMSRPEYAGGVILDGVVRTVPQAIGLDTMLKSLGRKVDAVVSLEVPDEEIVRRMGTRTVCSTCQTPYSDLKPGDRCPNCGGVVMRRTDDEPEAVRNRLVVYQRQTAPVIEWYRKSGAKVETIEATGDVDEITKRAMKAVGE